MRRLLRAALTVPLIGSCGEVLLVDPEVTFVSTGDYVVDGEFSLTLGLYDEQLFDPIEEGDLLPIVNGFQGGTWVMPALRCTGVTETVTMSASLVMTDGEVLGEVAPFDIRLDRTPDGSLDANAVPIPVDRGDEPLEDVFGEEAVLRIVVRDQLGTSGEIEEVVTLTDG